MIGVRAAETPLTASEIDDGLDVLNDLLAAWDATGTLRGIPPTDDVGVELQEPRYASGALKANVAVKLAAEFGIQLNQSIADNARESLQELVKASIDLSDVEYPATVPLGSGNRDEWYGYDRDFFPENTKRNF